MNVIDKLYEKYLEKYLGFEDVPSKDLFWIELKQNPIFAKKWGLEIKEEYLTLNERLYMFKKQYPNNSIEDFSPGGEETRSIEHQLEIRLDNSGTPAKIITLLCNGEKNEIYE